jgi:prepilin-type N-terminal cleavage/methylation domain-containing protein
MQGLDLYLHCLRAALNVNQSRAREICDEVRSHLEAQVLEFQRSGLSREDAVTTAIAKFGEPKAIAQSLATANSQHRRALALRGMALGAAIGSVVFYAAGVVMWLTSQVSVHQVTEGWREAVVLGLPVGGLSGFAVCRWAARPRRLAGIVGVVALGPNLAWAFALFKTGCFMDRAAALDYAASMMVPLAGVFAVAAYAASSLVERWMLRPAGLFPSRGHGGRRRGVPPESAAAKAGGGRQSLPRDAPGRRRQGFTLIELLIAAAVIGILAALTMSVVVGTRGSARQASCMNNLRQIGMAFQMYCDDYGGRPIQITDLVETGYATPDILVCPEDAAGDQGGLVCRGNAGERPECWDSSVRLPTSYIYLSGRRTDDLWSRLEALASGGSYLVCQCHGHKLGQWGPSQPIPWYEGKVLRLSFDGSVHIGRTEWAHGRDWQEVSNLWKLFTNVPGEWPFDDHPPV